MAHEVNNRRTEALHPDFTAYKREIETNGMTPELLNKIIEKHRPNAIYNKHLHDRYKAVGHALPIFTRDPRFEEDKDAINNKINNDFFGEIIDVKTGYFAGNPIGYSYSASTEALEDTGGEVAVDEAAKTLTDFTVRNNMYDADMEATKLAATCGYTGRLMYIDAEGNERIMIIPPYETIILSDTDISEPAYAIRYYEVEDINDNKSYVAEFYDSVSVTYYKGDIGSMVLDDTRPAKPHLFDYCPLQGIANNGEYLGDAEKVLALIDAYDRTMSDVSNEIESFANAYMVYENVQIEDDEIAKSQKSGAIKFFSGGMGGKVYFLTKDVNDNFVQNHLNRTEDNIYRFSKTPNLGDETFGTASGVALKFKITGLETKCGMFQAKMQSAGTYMFKVLASSWRKKQIAFDPLQVVMDFKRNFPLDLLSEAQAVSALLGAGLPKRTAFGQLSFVDDVEEIMQLIEEEQDNIPDLDFDFEIDGMKGKNDNKEVKTEEEEEE